MNAVVSFSHSMEIGMIRHKTSKEIMNEAGYLSIIFQMVLAVVHQP